MKPSTEKSRAMWKWRDDPTDDLVLKLYASLVVAAVAFFLAYNLLQ